MSHRNKSVLQKQYRKKEINGFSLVQTEIIHATKGEVQPQTRQDVLRQAAKLIRELHILNTKLQHQLCNSRTHSDMPPMYTYGGLESTICPSTMQDSYSPILTECFIEPNGVWQMANSMDYELHDTYMPLGEKEPTDIASVYGHVISQMNFGQWSPDHQLQNLHY